MSIDFSFVPYETTVSSQHALDEVLARGDESRKVFIRSIGAIVIDGDWRDIVFVAENGSSVEARGRCLVAACGHSVVRPHRNAWVMAFDNSAVVPAERCRRVVLRDNSSVLVSPSTQMPTEFLSSLLDRRISDGTMSPWNEDEERELFRADFDAALGKPNESDPAAAPAFPVIFDGPEEILFDADDFPVDNRFSL